MRLGQLKSDAILRGLVFPEPVRVITVVPMGDAVKLIGNMIGRNKQL